MSKKSRWLDSEPSESSHLRVLDFAEQYSQLPLRTVIDCLLMAEHQTRAADDSGDSEKRFLRIATAELDRAAARAGEQAGD